MNRLLKLLSTLLTVSSSSILTTSIVSCTVSNNQKVNDETKKDDDSKSDGEANNSDQSRDDSNNQNGNEPKTDDENNNVNPTPNDNDQSDRSDENQEPNSDKDGDSNINPGNDNRTDDENSNVDPTPNEETKPDESNDNSNDESSSDPNPNKVIDLSKISDLNELNNVYFKQTIDNFKEIKNSKTNIEKMILNRDLPSNFYSHSDFHLDKSEIILDEHDNKSVSLKLMNKNGSEISNSEIKWYQRTLVPYDKVFEVNQNNDKEVTFNLLSGGEIQWKDNTDPDRLSAQEATQAKIYAEYKGYLFSANVKVLHKAYSDLQHKNNLAMQEAKKIVDQHNWRELPTLERLKQAYKWITKNVEYDFDKRNLFENQNAHTALIGRKTVCTGYAKGLKMLLEELDIPCKFVEGESTRENGAKHAWNQVQIDNKWYYVDATSDRVDKNKGQQETEFIYFLNTDDDFSLTDRFTRNNDNKDAHLRNLLSKNFVSTKEDFIGFIDNNYNVETKKIDSFTIYIPNGDANKNKKPDFSVVHNAVKERGNFDYESKQLSSIGSFYVFRYSFPQTPKTPDHQFKEVDVVNIKKIDDKNSIEVEFDQQVDGLNAKNFNITNALIKNVEQKGKSYILNLHHFNSFGNVKVKLESVKRKDYKFNISKDLLVEFNLTKQNLPNIKAKIIDDKKVQLISDDKDLQYSFEYSKWSDVKKDLIIELPAQQGKLFVKSKNDLIAETKTIEFSRLSLSDNQLKVFNNSIVGVNDSMEYREKNTSSWKAINKNKITNLKKGSTYEVRYKTKDLVFASESVFVTIA
ncbi:hypothetical protein NX779_02735 [Mycoplasma cottewii]|uniref:Transglutaminase-like domain-containing protein n=1 Tax=Mycoplasma cottewii TaxID=51364 RepID=A0ABY5TWI9_9MOLU|nr:transglutaminase domain-containing protein [Mycoplasma cottewii]UWD34709.1 hypothetical protein NX779_02735 [Mycoplasma cottewii]